MVQSSPLFKPFRMQLRQKEVNAQQREFLSAGSMRVPVRLLFIVTLIIAGQPCSAGGEGGQTPARQGRLTDNSSFSRTGESIQAMMDKAVADRRIPAAIAMLARESEIQWLGTAGEMTHGVPMRRDAILPLASVGKMFTATAAMILYERDLLSLDDPVSKYIPDFGDLRIKVRDGAGQESPVTPARPVTIFHLLTHTSGLTVTGDEFWAAWNAHVGNTTTTHFARALARLPLQFQPGEQFQYGQTGAAYEVLGAVIEICSGQTLEQFMTDNIFKPLGLEDTYFYLPAEKAARLPEVYRMVDGELQLERAYGEDFSRSTYFHGGGGVRSAPDDILQFAQIFLGGGAVGEVRILEPETVALMMSDQLGDKAPDRWKSRGLSWGFGAAVEYAPEDTRPGIPSRYGWVGGGFAKLWVDTREQLVAYLNFPLTPPGDNALLVEFEQRVYASPDQ